MMNTIGLRIRQRRTAIYMKQVELAKRIERSQGFVSKVERGVIMAPVAIVQRIAYELDTTIEYLMQEEVPTSDREQGRQALRHIRNAYHHRLFDSMPAMLLEARSHVYLRRPETEIQLDFWHARYHRERGEFKQGLDLLSPWLERQNELTAPRFAELLYLTGQILRLEANVEPTQSSPQSGDKNTRERFRRLTKSLSLLLRSEEIWEDTGEYFGARVRNSVPIEIGLCYLALDQIERANTHFSQAGQQIDAELQFYHQRLAHAYLARVKQPGVEGLITNRYAPVLAVSESFKRMSRQVLAMVSPFIKMNTLFVTVNDGQTNYLVHAHNQAEKLVTEGALPFYESYCMHVGSQEDVLIIEDTLADERTGNMRITKTIGRTTFVGVPITLSDGYQIGAICALDRRSYGLSDGDIELLHHAADLLASVIELENITD